MTQDTKNKFAAILAAAQAKAWEQTKVNFTTPKPEPVKEYDNLKDMEQAANEGKVISLLNMANLVNDKKQPEPEKPLQELSSYTIEDILTGCEPEQDETQATNEPIAALKIVDYSDRSFAIVTETKPAEDVLNILRLHGSYNAHLKCGKGWIFSKRHLETIKNKLGL